DLFSDKMMYQKINSILLPLHTGEILGFKSKLLYFIIALIGFSLPITGSLIFYNKVKPARRKSQIA
ncbi:MAG: PepSY-associated TM helix domain-containing protein, partial [Bacteroidota bacterium]